MRDLTIREKRQYLREQNKKWPRELKEWAKPDWPPSSLPVHKQAIRIWRNRDFVVCLYDYPAGTPLRLTINRTEIDSDGRWKDGITWDEIQQLKREAGFSATQAIEFYPPDVDLINDANMRHIFLLPGEAALTFCWTAENRATV